MSTEDAPPLAAPLVGTVISGRYRIDALLGEGGMGAVYVGEHLLMHKRVAVKVLHPEMLGNSEIVARFRREAMAAAHMEHPNVAAATDFGELPDGAFFLVLELLEGTSLRSLLDRERALDVPTALHIARQVTSALIRAHALKIVHRDIKPDNVMLVLRDADPLFVKVLDFGIAKVPVAELAGRSIATPKDAKGLTQLGVMYGTPEYMSPEQVLGGEVDGRADLYSLGVMLYEMLSGGLPFVSENRLGVVTMHVTAPPPPLRGSAPQVSAEVEAVVMRLLEKAPARRFESARELSDALDALLGREAPRASVVLGAGAAAQGASDTVFAARSVVAPAGTMRFGTSHAGRIAAELAAVRARLPAPLRALPPILFLALPAVLVLFVLAAGVFLTSMGGSKSQTPAPRGDTPAAEVARSASDAELQDASKRGAAALRELGQRFPDDVRIPRALVLSLSDERRRADAMRELRALVERDPAAVDDEGAQRAVRAAAEDPDAADAAFELLEGALGRTGTELLFDLQTSAKAGGRATKSLARPEVRERSPAIAVALELKGALSCEAKKALLGRVRESGDRRVLSALRGLKNTFGCGFLRRGDCWPCLRQGTDLADSVREIEAREGAAKAASSPPP